MTVLHKCAKIAQRKAIFSFSFIVFYFKKPECT